MRVLIVKRDKLGDLLLTTPLLVRLAAARPDAEIHLLANDYNAWVARDHPAVHRTWTYPRVRDGGRLRLQAALAHLPIAWRLRRQRFDVAVVMGGDESPRGIRRAIGTGAARVVAYAHDAARYGARLTDPLPRAVRRPRGRAHARAARTAARAAAPGRGQPDVRAARGVARVRAAVARRARPRARRLRGRRPRRAAGEEAAGHRRRCCAGAATCTTRMVSRRVFTWTPGARDAPGYPGDDAIAAPVLARAACRTSIRSAGRSARRSRCCGTRARRCCRIRG